MYLVMMKGQTCFIKNVLSNCRDNNCYFRVIFENATMRNNTKYQESNAAKNVQNLFCIL
eukprot:TRINITY_DN624_c0_g1_i1.p1 TRINITY_DN624_c0_g1~~TRINITY_DN624_c0_g1_i1.p1  ORF type:complete len:59 (-),score=2.69 TRINITY_DN624_c0_g1_i1:456-632(-)